MNYNIIKAEQMIVNRAWKNKTPVNGSLELLPLCNMNCDMCYVRLSREEMESQGRLRTIDEWLEIAQEMQKSGVLFLLLTGGEPLLYPGFEELYIELLKLGFILTINTNGTLIDEKWASFFAENKPRRINVTLYGTNEKIYRDLCHYSEGFEKALQGIRFLKKYNVDVKINGSATKQNQENILELLKIGEDLGVPVNIDTYMMPAIRERKKPYNMQGRLEPIAAANARIQSIKGELGEESFKKYAERMLWKRDNPIPSEEVLGHVTCLAGNCSFSINWQGELRPCVILTEPAASVFDIGFENAWKHVVEEVQKILLSPKCNVCTMRPFCRTCAACALLETGSYEGIPDYMCQYTGESFRLLEEYLSGRN